MPTETSLLILKLKNAEFNRGLDQSIAKVEKLKKASAGLEKTVGGVSSVTVDAGKTMEKSSGSVTKMAVGIGAAVYAFKKLKPMLGGLKGDFGGIVGNIKSMNDMITKLTAKKGKMVSLADAMRNLGGGTISRKPMKMRVLYGSGGPRRDGGKEPLQFNAPWAVNNTSAAAMRDSQGFRDRISGMSSRFGGIANRKWTTRQPPPIPGRGFMKTLQGELAGKTSVGLKGLARSAPGIARLSGVVSRLGGAFTSTAAAAGGFIATAAGVATVIGIAVAALVAWYKIVKASFIAANALEVSTVRMGAVIKATGHSAGFTTKYMMEMAQQMQDTTGISKLMIADMMSVLATFREIKGDRFRQASEAILDMSQALKMDLKSAALQVGKALNDPIRGVSALSEAGIQFTTAQREQIKAMVEANNIAGAQKMILEELKNQFGGTSKAMGDTMTANVQKLKNAFTDLFEQIGEYYKTMWPFKDFIKGLTWSVQKLTKAMEWLNEQLKIVKGIDWNVIKSAFGFAELKGPAPTEPIKRFKKEDNNVRTWEPSRLVGEALAGSQGAATVARSRSMQDFQAMIADNTKRAAELLEQLNNKNNPPAPPKQDPPLVKPTPPPPGTKSVFEPYVEPRDTGSLWNHKGNYTQY